jgi:hypothetical protein
VGREGLSLVCARLRLRKVFCFLMRVALALAIIRGMVVIVDVVC